MQQIRSTPGAMKASEQVSLIPTAKPMCPFGAGTRWRLTGTKLAMKHELEVLRRENKLMTSAYYDLSSRLQLNNVSLQRRSEPPRSWLNRQRQLVSQATAVRSR